MCNKAPSARSGPLCVALCDGSIQVSQYVLRYYARLCAHTSFVIGVVVTVFSLVKSLAQLCSHIYNNTRVLHYYKNSHFIKSQHPHRTYKRNHVKVKWNYLLCKS